MGAHRICERRRQHKEAVDFDDLADKLRKEEKDRAAETAELARSHAEVTQLPACVNAWFFAMPHALKSSLLAVELRG